MDYRSVPSSINGDWSPFPQRSKCLHRAATCRQLVEKEKLSWDVVVRWHIIERNGFSSGSTRACKPVIRPSRLWSLFCGVVSPKGNLQTTIRPSCELIVCDNQDPYEFLKTIIEATYIFWNPKGRDSVMKHRTQNGHLPQTFIYDATLVGVTHVDKLPIAP